MPRAARITLADIEAARERIAGGIYESPCVESIPLSQLTGAHIYCKLDYLQRTGSFKERGARNALLQLSPEQRERGVIAASAGNHAQGIAYHGSLLGIPVTVVMPKFAPLIKVTNCRQLGADVVLHGADLAEARAARGDDRRARRPDVHPSVRQRRTSSPARARSGSRSSSRRPTSRRSSCRSAAAGCSRASAPSFKALQARRARHRRRAGARRVPDGGAAPPGTPVPVDAVARRSPTASPSRRLGTRPFEILRARRRPGRDGRRGDDRARGAAPDRAREERRRRRRRRAARRVPRRASSTPEGQATSCSCCAAATST